MEYLTRPVEGLGEVRFAHLTTYDVLGSPGRPTPNGLLPLHRRRLKEELLENLRLAEFDKGQIAVELNAFDREQKQRDQRQCFVEYLREAPSAMDDVLTLSYGNANAGATVPREIAADDRNELFWKLVEPFGITPAAPDEATPPDKSAAYGDGGDDSPNPKAPLTYSNPTEPGVVAGGAIGSTPS